MIKTHLKHGLAAIWRRKSAPRIIYHHSIHPSDSLSLSPDMFHRQIVWLQEEGYCFFTFSHMVQQTLAGKVQPKSVSITFDDGYLDNYEYAFPILKELGVPATFFIVSGMIKDVSENTREGNLLYPDRLMMNKRHVAELAAAGMEVGSHTRTHIHLRYMLKKSPVQALEELCSSRNELEEITGREVSSFAYPNGQKGVFDVSTRELLAEAGYQFAATTMWGQMNAGCDPLAIPRIEMRNDDSFHIFRAKMSGQYDFMGWFHQVHDGSRQWGSVD